MAFALLLHALCSTVQQDAAAAATVSTLSVATHQLLTLDLSKLNNNNNDGLKDNKDCSAAAVAHTPRMRLKTPRSSRGPAVTIRTALSARLKQRAQQNPTTVTTPRMTALVATHKPAAPEAMPGQLSPAASSSSCSADGQAAAAHTPQGACNHAMFDTGIEEGDESATPHHADSTLPRLLHMGDSIADQ